MSRNAFLIVWCPDDEELGEPLLSIGSTFGVVAFTLSLRYGVWPLGMVVEYEREEWMVILGSSEKGNEIQVIVSENDIIEGPAPNGFYLTEYVWLYDAKARKEAKLRHVDPGKKATLTEIEVVEIYNRYHSPEHPRQIDLAHEYGVGQKQISNIVLRRAWAYLWE